jgi:nucleoside-diphosphate-sugar epimerase
LKYHELCIDVNARGAFHLYEAAARAHIPRVVYVGSLTAVLGYPRYQVLDEEVADRPANVYAACKIFGEHAGRAYAYKELTGASGMQVICLRLGQPYPSEFFSMRDHQWLKTAGGRALAADVRDIAFAIDCALQTDVHYGVYSIVSGSDEPYVSPELYKELGYRPQWKFTSEGLFPVEESEVFEPQVAVTTETV